MENKNQGPGILGQDDTLDYIDDGTLCRARSPKPGVVGGAPPPDSPAQLYGTNSQEETRESLALLYKASTYIKDHITDFTQESLDTAVGAVKGAAWAAETIAQELLDSARSLYQYVANGSVRQDMLSAALKYTVFLSNSRAIVYGLDPVGQSYEEIKGNYRL